MRLPFGAICCVAATIVLHFTPVAIAADLYNDADTRSAALGGEAVAAVDSPLAAMEANPAALASLDRAAAALTITGAILQGKFTEPAGASSLQDGNGVIGSGAVELPMPNDWPVRFGLAVIPDLTLESEWQYTDPPGGLGGAASYGVQTYHSRLLSIRSTAAVSVKVTRWLSLGASGGAVYNENSLHGVYVFQSQPVLTGFKTLLDLQTDGFASTFDFGAQVYPISTLALGLSYRPRVVIDSSGRASGNARSQLLALGGAFAQAEPTFTYDAQVRTELPQRIAAGAEWAPGARIRLVAGVDWVNWSDAFDQLQIHLKDGSNADINAVVGSNSLTDFAPLRWRDQLIYRAGVELGLTENLRGRLGYSYGRSPVPNETLTPLTAAIFEHTIATGLGYQWGRYHLDFAWQFRLPATQYVDQSALRTGEYSHTSVAVSAHVLQLTTGVTF